MSAFEDYCIVCEKVSQEGSAYCSQACKLLDLDHSMSPTASLSSCSIHNLPCVKDSFSLTHSHSPSQNQLQLQQHQQHQQQQQQQQQLQLQHQQQPLLSPLLTPQIAPRLSVAESLKSPTLTYTSPLLHSTSLHCSNDLDSNHLDLNSTSISQRLSLSHSLGTSNPVINVGNLLHSSSENYKKWLSTH
ncbi:hypothetical protein CAS74_000668 [Pichia kudriavzevii]|uniref:Uncharacterized protein n=1 Tax=Pichia kudriavzevii TaxID=4909 RepID=A0A1Z8JUR0_PICKU|nr:hypothetical protein CAS74_000668 [Pichia kudriavzevii]